MKLSKTPFAAALGLMIGLAGCTDTEIVFRDRELFNAPPDASSGFLGYFDATDGVTTCGNCHVGAQRDWEATAHADAFETLEGSGSAQDFCYGCHTVSENGNALSEAAGWNATQDVAYHDVQCESCHGPGIAHVEDPDANQPIPAIGVPETLDNGCVECHAGNHHPFAEEWSRSGHAQPVSYIVDNDRVECIGCHTAQGVLKAWNVQATYEEQDDPLSEHLGITCAVCHDPHGSPNSAQLRFPIDVPSEEQNLCMKCHHKRAAPETDASTLRGPHSPEGPLLLGEGAGWFPPGFEPEVDRIVSSHGSGGNERLCATCHVATFTVDDQETGDFVWEATGHLFLAIPCTDQDGKPTEDQTCAIEERSFAGCATGSCHLGDPALARTALGATEDDIADAVNQVNALLADPTVAADFDRRDGIFTTPDGAWFNVQLAELSGSAVHNPFLIKNLLRATRNALCAEYNLGGSFPGICPS